MASENGVKLRLPRKISAGDIAEIKIKIIHPSRTGLGLNEEATRPYERFFRAESAQFVRSVQVFYDEEQISTILMNASTSDNPLLSIMVRADKEAPLRVVVLNHKNETFEATADIAFTE